MPNPYHQAFLRFNAGELTPYLRHTIDFEKHASGAEIVENYLPLPFGGVRKRPGTEHITTLDAATRLEAVTVRPGQQFILALTSDELTIFYPDGTVSQTIAAEFGDPFQIQFVHLNDNIFLAHPDWHPRLLLFQDTDDWALQDVPFSSPPLLDENLIETKTITTSFSDSTGASAWSDAGVSYAVGDRVSFMGEFYLCHFAHTSSATRDPEDGYKYVKAVYYAARRGYIFTFAPVWTQIFLDDSAPVGAEIDLVATEDIFEAGHVGAYWQISHQRPLDGFEVSFAATAGNDGLTSDPLIIQGAWTFNTFGTWTGTFVIERQRAPGEPWEDYRSYESSADRNVAADGFEDERVLMRIRWDHGAVGSSKPRGVLGSSEAFIRGIVRITAVTDGQNATAEVIQTVERTTTAYWSEGAFSDAQGFPSAIGVHERRLIFGGTSERPVSLWMSRTDDLVNFLTGTDDDHGIYITLAAVRQDPIRWIASQSRLFIGTEGGEWVFGSDNSDDPVSPSNLVAREHTNYGSAAMPALRSHSGIYFVERQGRRLREFAYLLDREAYDAADLTRLAEHITQGGIVQMDWQSNREPFLWCVRADGTLLAFAYHRAEAIAAWTRHTTTGGQFRSVAILRNEDEDDDIYVVVQRGATYHLERFASGQQALQEAGDVAAAHFVDSGTTGPTVGVNHELTVPAHLEGEILHVLADGQFFRLYVLAGKIQLPAAATEVHAGLPITSKLTLLPIDMIVEGGTTHARIKQGTEIVLNLYQTFGGSYTYDGNTEAIVYNNTSDIYGQPPPLFNGWKEITLPGAHLADLQVSFEHTEPFPFTLRNAVVRWLLHEP